MSVSMNDFRVDQAEGPLGRFLDSTDPQYRRHLLPLGLKLGFHAMPGVCLGRARMSKCLPVGASCTA